MHLLESLCLQQPSLHVLLLAPILTPEVLLMAMRAGAREVLPLPLDVNALQMALSRGLRRMGVLQQGQGEGQVCVFMPVRGGAGATLLATNLGYVLAAEHGKRVILIDLNLPFGEAEVYVGAERAQHCLADVTEKTAQLDESMLNSVLVKPHPKMGILATGDQLDRSVAITPEHLAVVINLAAKMADYVILDVSSTLNGLSLAAMDRATVIMPVLDASFPVIRNAKRMTDLFRRLGYSREKILPVINRYEGTGQITPDDISKALDLKVWQVLPDSAETAFASLNQGVPLIQLRPRDPLSRRVQEIANEMVRGAEPTTQSAGRKEADVAGGKLSGLVRASLSRWSSR
jgi:pilus assembly protein CpaE